MKMYQVDAFSQNLFQGNPAAVIVLDQWLDESLMQSIAQENNLSETAFVCVIDDQNYAIRWFTPSREIEFCGHATLASAFVLFRDFTNSRDTINFHVKDLGIFIIGQSPDGKINMDFPIRRAELLEHYPQLLREALTKPFKAVYLNAQAYIVEYESVQDVLDEQPDFAKLCELAVMPQTTSKPARNNVAITAAGQEHKYDCVSRYFAPAFGVNEDPVTGSAHTAIAPLWADKLNKTELVAYQASPNRGGELHCKILGEERIEISGYAKLYMVAEISIDDD